MQSDQFMADLPTKNGDSSIAMLVYQGVFNSIFLLNPVKSHLLMAKPYVFQVRKQVIIHVSTFSSHMFCSLRDHHGSSPFIDAVSMKNTAKDKVIHKIPPYVLGICPMNPIYIYIYTYIYIYIVYIYIYVCMYIYIYPKMSIRTQSPCVVSPVGGGCGRDAPGGRLHCWCPGGADHLTGGGTREKWLI